MPLKIQPQHYQHLAGQFKTLTDGEIRTVVGKAKQLKLSDNAKNKYIRHQLMDRRISAKWICDNLYPYMNDNHLDSALKKIISEQGIPQCYSSESEMQSA